MRSNSKRASTRRQLLIAALACAPGCAWAAATTPPAAPVTPTGDAANLASSARQALDELQARLEEMQSAQAQTTVLAAEYDSLMASAARSAAALEDKIREIEASIRRLEALAAKIERISQVIESLLPEFLAMVGSDRNGPAICRHIGSSLLASGYIDAAQNAAIADGKYRWRVQDIRAAVVRGRAGLVRFKRPESISDKKKDAAAR